MINVYIGTSLDQERPTKVLEYSIRKYASAPVVIHRLCAGEFMAESGVTGFTMFRYKIPEICAADYAIYLDCDMVLTADIAELYDYRSAGRWTCNGQREGDSVSVIDCRIGPVIGTTKHEARSYLRPYINTAIPNHWNAYDTVGKLIHFTGLATQPWKFERHPNPNAVKIWRDMEFEMNGC